LDLDILTESYNVDNILQEADGNLNFENQVVTKIILIQNMDSFGITDLVQKTRVGHSKSCEAYTCHWMLRNYTYEELQHYRTGKGKDIPDFVNDLLNTSVGETSSVESSRGKKRVH
jgi:hypothetical protein